MHPEHAPVRAHKGADMSLRRRREWENPRLHFSFQGGIHRGIRHLDDRNPGRLPVVFIADIGSNVQIIGAMCGHLLGAEKRLPEWKNIRIRMIHHPEAAWNRLSPVLCCTPVVHAKPRFQHVRNIVVKDGSQLSYVFIASRRVKCLCTQRRIFLHPTHYAPPRLPHAFRIASRRPVHASLQS